jgi:two-component system LytT family response regulator
MKLTCVAIDDEPLALELISQYLQQFPEFELTATFDDAIEGANFLQKNAIDLLLIDISMPDITGLELVASLKQKPMVIFTTAHKKFALEGFELDAIDYLLKPIAIERFSKALAKAAHFAGLKEETPQYLFVRAEYKIIKIDLNDILYIESLVDYVKIYVMTSSKPILTLMTLKAMLEKLPANQFSRIHRSYVVSNKKVKSVLKKEVELHTGQLLPVSNSYSAFIENWLMK